LSLAEDIQRSISNKRESSEIFQVSEAKNPDQGLSIDTTFRRINTAGIVPLKGLEPCTFVNITHNIFRKHRMHLRVQPQVRGSEAQLCQPP
jgi:hypothetical protein